jgi:hypothetical protein
MNDFFASAVDAGIVWAVCHGQPVAFAQYRW